MKAVKKEDTLTGIAKQKLDRLENIERLLQNIDNRQKEDWRLFLRSKRRQAFIAIIMIVIAVTGLYHDIIRFNDVDIFKHRINEAISAPVVIYDDKWHIS